MTLLAVLGIEGPGGFVGTGWHDQEQQPAIVRAAREVETEPSLLGLNSHLFAIARREA